MRRQFLFAPHRASAIIVIAASTILVSACGMTWPGNFSLVYRPDIQQGNLVDELMMHKLQSGMSKEEVTETLGTPLVPGTFRRDRWYYVHSIQKDDGPRQQSTIVLRFSEDDRLIGVGGDVVARTGPAPTGEEERRRVITVPDAPLPGLFGRLFGDDDTPSPLPPTPTKQKESDEITTN